MQNKQEEGPVQGRPWKIVKKLNTYIEAIAFRDEVLKAWAAEKNTLMQIKIKRMNDPVLYTVRTRQDPEKLKEASKKKKEKKISKKA